MSLSRTSTVDEYARMVRNAIFEVEDLTFMEMTRLPGEEIPFHTRLNDATRRKVLDGDTHE